MLYFISIFKTKAVLSSQILHLGQNTLSRRGTASSQPEDPCQRPRQFSPVQAAEDYCVVVARACGSRLLWRFILIKCTARASVLIKWILLSSFPAFVGRVVGFSEAKHLSPPFVIMWPIYLLWRCWPTDLVLELDFLIVWLGSGQMGTTRASSCRRHIVILQRVPGIIYTCRSALLECVQCIL